MPMQATSRVPLQVDGGAARGAGSLLRASAHARHRRVHRSEALIGAAEPASMTATLATSTGWHPRAIAQDCSSTSPGSTSTCGASTRPAGSTVLASANPWQALRSRDSCREERLHHPAPARVRLLAVERQRAHRVLRRGQVDDAQARADDVGDERLLAVVGDDHGARLARQRHAPARAQVGEVVRGQGGAPAAGHQQAPVVGGHRQGHRLAGGGHRAQLGQGAGRIGGGLQHHQLVAIAQRDHHPVVGATSSCEGEPRSAVRPSSRGAPCRSTTRTARASSSAM